MRSIPLRPGPFLLAFALLASVVTTPSYSDADGLETLKRPSVVELPAGLSQEGEPIAAIGHGAFFDRSGKQIVPTAEWVEDAQDWYRAKLLAGLPADRHAEFEDFERRLNVRSIGMNEQTRLIVRQRSLQWLMANTSDSVLDHRTLGKLKALNRQLKWKLPIRDDLEELRTLEDFELDPITASRLERPDLDPGQVVNKLITANSGQAYIDECAMWGVPIPPSINVMDPAGLTGWRSLGFIPPADQFIVFTPAEVRVFEGNGGMCIALPRYNNNQTQVLLDGVICLSQTSSKVCFWDNQDNNGDTFFFSPTDIIPIGVPTTPGGDFQAGGAVLVGGDGGECTDCHAGENPYVVHPDSDLGTVLFGDMSGSLGLPTFGPDRFDPIVGAGWYENDLSHSQALVPPACSGCHQQGGVAGRFPHLSSDIPMYCNTILAQAVDGPKATMPPGSPGSEAGTTALDNFLAYCNTAPSAGPSNRGDPHITTTNGVKYDFQAAGEFVALRNSATKFELQTRQTPVLTTFTPGPNPHTGLSSCVALNTAAAIRLGKTVISYTPGREGMVLRINGKQTSVHQIGINLGGGNWIAGSPVGDGFEVKAADGTRVIVTPNHWASQGYDYLNIEVLDTPAREGIMGPILGTDWLPLGPGGSSFGPKPPGLPARDVTLNQVFANAWRVTNDTSLFHYENETSTETFTETSWPPPSGSSCTEIASNPWPGGEPRRPVRGMSKKEAAAHCSILDDPEAFADCVYDMTLLGDPDIAYAYWLTLHLRNF